MITYISNKKRFQIQTLYPTDRRKKGPSYVLIVDTHYNVNDDDMLLFQRHSPTPIYRILLYEKSDDYNVRHIEERFENKVQKMNIQYNLGLYLERYS